MTIDRKIYLLLKNSYNTKDIMELKKCSSSTANRIKKVCRKYFKGSIRSEINRHSITASSFWLSEGSSIEKEVEKIKEIIGEERFNEKTLQERNVWK